MLEPVAFVIIGILLIYLGKYFFNLYKEDFTNDSGLAISWDTIVQILGAGTSNGRIAISCFIAGGSLLALGAFIFLLQFGVVIFG